jgi:hypothetical protein
MYIPGGVLFLIVLWWFYSSIGKNDSAINGFLKFIFWVGVVIATPLCLYFGYLFCDIMVNGSGHKSWGQAGGWTYAEKCKYEDISDIATAHPSTGAPDRKTFVPISTIPIGDSGPRVLSKSELKKGITTAQLDSLELGLLITYDPKIKK